jgi:hypothetical protein
LSLILAIKRYLQVTIDYGKKISDSMTKSTSLTYYFSVLKQGRTRAREVDLFHCILEGAREGIFSTGGGGGGEGREREREK